MASKSIVKSIFWIMLLVVMYSLIGFPLICLLLALIVGKRKPPENYFPRVSVIVAAYNEEHIISKKIDNLLSQEFPQENLEIIVVSDASTDRTEEIVQSYASQGVVLLPLNERTGVSEAFHRGVQMSTGDILMFTDATGMFSHDALAKMMRWFADPKVGCVCGRDAYDREENTSIGKGWSLYIHYENLLRRLEGNLFSPIVVTGSIHAIRRHLHRRVPSQYTNDLVTPLSILKEGYAVRFEPEALIADKPEAQLKQDMKARVRVAARGAETVWYMREMCNPIRHPVVAFQLFSRKIVRWLTGLFACVLFCSNWHLRCEGPFYRLFFWGQVVFYIGAAAEFFIQKAGRKTVFYVPFYIFTIHLCALLGMWEFLNGRDYSVWEPSRSE